MRTSCIVVSAAQVHANILSIFCRTAISPRNAVGTRKAATSLGFVEVEKVAKRRGPVKVERRRAQ